MFWLAWRLPDRAVAVVVAADPGQGLRARDPAVIPSRDPCDAEVPACGAVLAGADQSDLPGRKRRVLIADAGQRRGRDVASVAVLVPAGGKGEVTTEALELASVREVDLIAAKDKEPGAAEVAVLARVVIMECVLVAVRHHASVGDGVPARVEALDLAPAWDVDLVAAENEDRGKVEVPVLVPAEGMECVSGEARNPGSAGGVDLAPVADMVEVGTLAATESHVKKDPDEVRDRVAIRTPALAADMDSVSTDATVPAHLPRASRNRKFR